MKGWKLSAPLKLTESEIEDLPQENAQAKIKITKALITLSSLYRFRGDIDCPNIVLGSSAIGVVSESDTNLFNIEKGTRVFLNPNRECLECYNCKMGDTKRCIDMHTVGENVDGYLCDFASVPCDKIFPLPDSVSDSDALFINQISLALSIIDKLDVQKGDYVTIVGANNFGNLFAQLMIYYQAVPIVIAGNMENFEIAKKSGIYYVLSPEDNCQKEIAIITSGRMSNKVLYICDCNIPVNKAFSLASFDAKVGFTGTFTKNNSPSFSTAIRKQLNIHFINNGFENIASSINILANKAISTQHLKLNSCSYDSVPQTFKSLSEQLDSEGKIDETIVNLI